MRDIKETGEQCWGRLASLQAFMGREEEFTEKEAVNLWRDWLVSER